MSAMPQSPDAGFAGDSGKVNGAGFAGEAEANGQYVVAVRGVFITVTVSWAGVPAVGPDAIGAATVAASQNKLDLTAVVVVSVLASE